MVTIIVPVTVAVLVAICLNAVPKTKPTTIPRTNIPKSANPKGIVF